MELSKIIVGERARKEMGDLRSLADSIARHGLLHPIVVKSDGTLVAGHRRIDKGETLHVTLGIVTSAWGTKASALEGRLLDGIGLVVGRFNGTIDKPAMVKKLAKYPGGASGLLGDARGVMEYRKTTLSKCVAERVIESYNSGRRIGKLDPL